MATEDHRFYQHHGIDFKRTAGAIFYSLKGDAQGGSTITQQLARNMFPEEIGRSRNLNRKLKELITALKIEATYSKAEILEAYLNTVPFLYNTFGIEMAARTYFDKPAAQLDILESATLVGMLKGTNYYNPVTNPERSVERRNVVLGQMLKHGVINQARFKALSKRPLRVHFARQAERPGTDTHFTAYVRKWLIDWADENDYNLQLDGLVVHTTLDYALQQAALHAVERQANALQAVADVEWSQPGVNVSQLDRRLRRRCAARSTRSSISGSRTPRWPTPSCASRPNTARRSRVAKRRPAALKRLKADRNFIAQLHAAKSRLEAGFVALDPASGEVKAWVGSRDFQREQFDHVVKAARQPGSTFKPIVYGAALEKGLTPDHPYRDAVMNIKAGDGTIWRPTDMTGTTGNQMTMRDGLVFSKNTITAQVMQDVGLPRDHQPGQGARHQPEQAAVGAVAGAGHQPGDAAGNGQRLRDHRRAGRLPQAGVRHPHHRPRRQDHRRLRRRQRRSARCRRPSAVTLIDMMRGVINRGTGTAIRNRFGIAADVAGKTGTTQNNADGWFILMHPNLVAGRLGRLQRQPRQHAQRVLGPGRPQCDAAGGRLLQDGARQRQARPRGAVPGRAARGAGAAAGGAARGDGGGAAKCARRACRRLRSRRRR